MSVINYGTGYLAPGVYVQAVSTPTPTISNVPSDVIALVGPAQGYLSYTDGLALSQTQTTSLTQSGISEGTIVVTDSSGVVQNGSNYTITQEGSSPDQTTQIELTEGTTMTPGVVYYISYNYTDEDYYTPQSFTSYQTLQAVYGAPFTLAGGISSPISLAAIFAFQGASTVVVMPSSDTGNATRAGLQNAYSALEAINGIDLIVPLPVGMTGTSESPGDILNVAADLGAHCAAMSVPTVGYYRTGLIGYETTVTVGPDVIAQGTANMRVDECWPNSLSYYNPIANTSINIAGYYLAAACAGKLAGQPVQQGLTRQTISGFNGIPNSVMLTMTEAYKDQLSAAGVCVLEPASNNGGLVIRDGTTTLPGNSMTKEISLVRCSDAMLEVLSTSLKSSGLIGTPIVSTTVSTITSIIQGALSYLTNDGVIQGYTALSVVQNTGNATVMDVTFGYLPSYPLNYINVSFSVATTTGTITPTTQTGSTSSTSGSTISSS